MSELTEARNPGLVKWAWALAAALCICIIVFAHLWKLRQVPSNVTGDEVTLLNDVLRVIVAPDKVTPLSFMGDGSQAGLNFYYMAGMARRLSEGDAVLAMRLSSAFLGLGVLIAFYLYIRTKVCSAASLAATFLLGTNYVFLNLSRATWMSDGKGLVLIPGLLAFWFVERAAQKRSWRWVIPAGLLVGVALYSYIWASALAAAALAYLGGLALLKRLPWKAALSYGGILLALAALVAAPFFVQVNKNYDRYTLRAKSVYISKAYRPYYGQDDMPGILWHQAAYTVRGFLFLDPGVTSEGVENQRYVPTGEGPVDPVTRVLFFAGLAAAVLFHRKNIALAALALGGVLLGTQMLTQLPPNFARGVFGLIFIYIVLAVALDWAFKAQRFRRWLPTALMLVVVGLGLWNTRHYFQWSASARLASARQPAIQYQHVPLWVEAQTLHIKGGQYDLTITSEEWQRLVTSQRNSPATR